MNKEDGKIENVNASVPYIVHEGEVSRLERIIKRLWTALIILVFTLFSSTLVWIWYINQYDYETYEVYTDGAGNANYIGEDGDIYNGSTSSSEEAY